MKRLDSNQLAQMEAGTNRQCLIDGALTAVGVAIGGAAGGALGAAAAFLGGLYAANSNGCF